MARHREQEAALALLAFEQQMLDPLDAAQAIIDAYHEGVEPLAYAFDAGLIDPDDVMIVASQELDLDVADLEDPDSTIEVDPTLLDGLDPGALERLSLLPVRRAGEPIVLAAETSSPDVTDFTQLNLGGLPLVPAPRRQLTELLHVELARRATQEMVGQRFDLTADDQRVRRYITTLLEAAAAQRASDIHLHRDASGKLTVRFRLDGVLVDQPTPPPGAEEQVINAAMTMAGMPTTARSQPHDGRYEFTTHGREVAVRVSMVPTVTGPKIVMRLLDPSNMKVTLNQLGFSAQTMESITRMMGRQAGAVLVSGPTGSGKSTTLYAMLKNATTSEVNVSTVEDPVEFPLEGTAQTEVVEREDGRSVDFAGMLRNLVRQDPDVILVGEIRDKETGVMAMEAAITGHLLLSTIHAPDTISTFSRLTMMGVPAYQVASALTMVLSQRLLRRLHTCATWRAPDVDDLRALTQLGLHMPEVRVPVGCSRCFGTGYRGRVAAAELLVPDRRLRAVIEQGGASDEVAAAADQSGAFQPFSVDAIRHLEDGTTSPAEVLRVLDGLL